MATAELDKAEEQKHEQRQRFIGGSDIAGILGVSPWDSPADIYRKKTEPRKPASASKKKLFRRGHAWEKVVGEMLVTELELQGHKAEVVGANKQYQDEEHEFFACEVDFELRIDDSEDITNVELKTVHPFGAKNWGDTEDDCPTHYSAQVHWGLGVTKRKNGILAALFGADYLRVYPTPADEGVIPWMRNEAKDFWENHVVPKVLPPAKTLGDVAKQFANDNGESKLADDELTEKWLRLRALQKQMEACEAEAESLEFAIKCAMGEAQILESAAYSQPIVTWKDRKGSWLNQSALKEAHPKIHREFMRSGTSRVFMVKNPKK